MRPGETSSEDQKTPGGPLSQGWVGQEGHCQQVGERLGTLQRRGSGSASVGTAEAAWPGETCSPTLCCVAAIKLLPFVMVPRGGVKQLLIKTDVSEVAPPEPFHPSNRERSHRGARGLRPAPQQPGGERPAPVAVPVGPDRHRVGGQGGAGDGLGGGRRMLRVGCEARGALGRRRATRRAVAGGKRWEEEKPGSN